MVAGKNLLLKFILILDTGTGSQIKSNFFENCAMILHTNRIKMTLTRDAPDIRPDNPAFFISGIRPDTGLHRRISCKA
jgi:hypothetical protein